MIATDKNCWVIAFSNSQSILPQSYMYNDLILSMSYNGFAFVAMTSVKKLFVIK